MPSDDQAQSEALDRDKVGTPYPPDRPLAADEDPEETIDSVEERARREQPDRPAGQADPAVEVVDPDPAGEADVEKDVVGERTERDPEQVRLPVDDEPAFDRPGALPAEEDAVHERAEDLG